MSKKKKFSSRVAESVDPMSAFVDDSEELAVPEDESVLTEALPVEEVAASQPVEDTQSKENKTEKQKPEASAETDILAMLHGTEMKPKVAVLEKNALPVQLLNKEAEKEKPVVIEAPNVGKLYDLLEVARQHAAGYQPTWDASLKAYARHMGFPSMASLEDNKAFLVKWGAKLKD
jgi:hypothetical protein